MNYKILKNIIENLLWNFSCPTCGSEVSENDLEVIGAAWNSLNINVACPQCSKNIMVKTEVAHIDLWKINAGNIPDEIKNKIKTLKSELPAPTKNQIKDEQIIDLNNKLKTISWVDELF